ncbi:MAG: transcription elongation factor GreA [Metamycoplasmataceae bacterium]
MENNKIQLTKEKFNDLKKELDFLITIERNKVIEEIKQARAQGDLSENAEYDAARDRQGIIEDRINELEKLIDQSTIIDEKKLSSTGVSVGSVVSFENLSTHKKEEIKIVNTLESDPFTNKISYFSPLGEALLNKEVGSEITIDAPNPYKIKIISIK